MKSSSSRSLFLLLSSSLLLQIVPSSNGFLLQTLGRGLMSNPLSSSPLTMPSLSNWGALMTGSSNMNVQCGGSGLANPCLAGQSSNQRPVNRLRRPRPSSMVQLPNAILSDYNSNPMMMPNAIVMPLNQCKWCRDNNQNRFNSPAKGSGRFNKGGGGKTNFPLRDEQKKEPFEQKREPFEQKREPFGQEKERGFGDVQQKMEQENDRKVPNRPLIPPRRDPIKSSSTESGRYSNQINSNQKLKLDENRVVIVVVHLNKNFMTDDKWKKLTTNGLPIESATLSSPTYSSSSPSSSSLYQESSERVRETERENDRPSSSDPYWDESSWSSNRIQSPERITNENRFSPMINTDHEFSRSRDQMERKETTNGWTILSKNP